MFEKFFLTKIIHIESSLRNKEKIYVQLNTPTKYNTKNNTCIKFMTHFILEIKFFGGFFGLHQAYINLFGRLRYPPLP